MTNIEFSRRSSITGAVVIYTCNTIGAKYAGLCLMQVFSSGMPLSMALVSSNIGGFTKRATVITGLFTCYCAGNIIGPQLFFAREAPRYKVITPTSKGRH
jgi:ACS family allantoate permease-like MFS transporter